MTTETVAPVPTTSRARLFASLERITLVDVILWLLRAGILILVVAGTVATLIKGTYSLSHCFDFFMFGLTTGGVYALLALGYAMVHGLVRLIHFAHGDVTVTGAFWGDSL